MSKKTFLKLRNDTNKKINVNVSDIDNHDWDGDSRPDHNFTNFDLDPHTEKVEREEINSGASASMFTLQIESEDGRKLVVRADQQVAAGGNTPREVSIKTLKAAGDAGSGVAANFTKLIAAVVELSGSNQAGFFGVAGENVEEFGVHKEIGGDTLSITVYDHVG